MSVFADVVFTPVGYILRIAMLLLLVLQAYVCILAFLRPRRPVYRAGTALHTVCIAAAIVLLTDRTYFPPHLPERVAFPAPVELLYSLPWLCFAVTELCSAAAIALCLLSDVRFTKSRPSSDSVKEALDDLPVGVCFIAANGTVTLANLQMNTWCQKLTDQPLSDGNRFLGAIESAGEHSNDQIILQLGEDCVLLFADAEIEVDGSSYRQLTAADITEQFHVTAYLERQNKKLRDISVRMKAYSVELTDLVMRRESLAARVMVHDTLGHILLRSKHWFEHPESDDAAALYALLCKADEYMLGAANAGSEPAEDPLANALQVAKGVGINVTVTGEPPQDTSLRRLLGQAVRECAMNAVKHADGDKMLVAVKKNLADYTVRIETNGAPAAEEITLSGGLRSLKDAVETLGGSMTVTPTPVFTVEMRLRR
ncbi:MAG: hypothetical protein IJL25_10565 [Clostridia bacterium]|nr:hypothetical protein [Clostridia bacterium]